VFLYTNCFDFSSLIRLDNHLGVFSSPLLTRLAVHSDEYQSERLMISCIAHIPSALFFFPSFFLLSFSFLVLSLWFMKSYIYHCVSCGVSLTVFFFYIGFRLAFLFFFCWRNHE
jgi:hypothetical protein